MSNQYNQYNHTTNKVYEGRNQAELMAAKRKNGYKSDAWLTFVQARSNKLKIKKGSRGISIFKGYGSFSDEREDKDGNTKIRSTSRPLGFARVFNLDQTELFIV